MCSRGVFQLALMRITFSDIGGSSKGIRSLLKGTELTEFVNKNPHLKLAINVNRSKHPHIDCHYINGYSKTLPLRNLESQEAMESILSAYNGSGRSSYKHAINKVISQNPSIQGKFEAGKTIDIQNVAIYTQPEPRQYPYQAPELVPIRKKRNLFKFPKLRKLVPRVVTMQSTEI